MPATGTLQDAALALEQMRRASEARKVLVRPEDITWSLDGETLEVRIRVKNRRSRRKPADRMTVGVAQFGAFLPSRPGARLEVPALRPGESIELRTTVPLRPEELDHGMPTPHWAGNIDVHFDADPECAVEVHRALDLQARAMGCTTFMAIPHAARVYRVQCGEMEEGWSVGLRLHLDPLRPATAPSDGLLSGPCVFLIRAPEAGARSALALTFVDDQGRNVRVELTLLASDTPVTACRRNPVLGTQLPVQGVRVQAGASA